MKDFADVPKSQRRKPGADADKWSYDDDEEVRLIATKDQQEEIQEEESSN